MNHKLITTLSILLAVVLANWPMLYGGFPLGHDYMIALTIISEFHTALVDGQWPPYWASNIYHGYGSPFFIYYGGVYPFVVSLMAAFTVHLVDAGAWASVLISGIGALGIFLLARALLPADPVGVVCARLATYSFLLFPYLIGDQLVRNANAEHAALCLAPYVFYGMVRMNRFPHQGMLILAPSLALVIFAHNLTSVSVFGAVVLLALVMYPPWIRGDRFVYVAAGIVLSLLLSGFFWFPLWLMLPLVTLENQTIGKFDFHNQFHDLGHYFDIGSFFSAGLLTPMLMIAAGVLLVVDRKLLHLLRPILLVLLCLALTLVFLLTRSSTPIWELLPLIRFFQFPWRFIGPLAIVMAIILAIVSYRWLMGRNKREVILLEMALLLAMLMQALPVLSMYRSVHEIHAPAELDVLLRPETIRESGFRNAIFPFFPKAPLDAGVDVNNYLTPEERKVPGANVLSNQRNGKTWLVEIQADYAMDFPLDIWAFPVISVLVNGVSAPLHVSKDGTWSVPVSAGISDIRIVFHPPEQRVWGLWVSGLGFLIYMILFAYRTQSARGSAARTEG